MMVFTILALLLGIITVLLTGLLCVNFLILINGVKVDDRAVSKTKMRKQSNANVKNPT